MQISNGIQIQVVNTSTQLSNEEQKQPSLPSSFEQEPQQTSSQIGILTVIQHQLSKLLQSEKSRKESQRKMYGSCDKMEERFYETQQLFYKMEERFGKMEERFGKMDERFGKMEEQFVSIQQNHQEIIDRFDRIEASHLQIKERLDETEQMYLGIKEINQLEHKIEKHLSNQSFLNQLFSLVKPSSQVIKRFQEVTNKTGQSLNENKSQTKQNLKNKN